MARRHRRRGPRRCRVSAGDDWIEPWERWCGSVAHPVVCIKRLAKVHIPDGRRWIIYREERNGAKVIVEMPENAGHCANGQPVRDHSSGATGIFIASIV